MAISNLLSQITRSLNDIQGLLEYEKENFESKFLYIKQKIEGYEKKIFHYQQKNLESEKSTKGETESEYESENEDLQNELEVTKCKLEQEETKNRELSQDVAELDALVGLYVREAQKREKLEEDWQESSTLKLKAKIKSLEDEIFRKIDEIDNLENTVMELRSNLIEKKAKILNKDKEIEILRRKVVEMELLQKSATESANNATKEEDNQ